MDEKINNYYKNFNYPSKEKLYKLMKKDNIKITLAQIQQWMMEQETEQLTKIVVNKTSSSIVAFNFFQFTQMDIFILDKYAGNNRGFIYIFCLIDVFTRKAFCIPLKHKGESDIIDALKTIFIEIKNIPHNILSDSDSAFLGNKIQAFMKKNDIIHNTVPIGDHKTLGIVDRFALTLKRILTKRLLATKSTNWVDGLSKIISVYNNTEHKSLLGLSPDEALKEENLEFVQSINLKKSENNQTINDLEQGDKVRILEKTIFKKKSDAIWSDKIYIVESTSGKTIYLTNGIKKKRDMLLKVPQNTKDTKINVDKEATKEKRIKTKLKAVGVEEQNIKTSSREKKPRKVLDL